MVKVLELFAGIGACSKALEYGGEEYEIVDAVEIDKYAMSSFNAIHGTNFEVQDITEWDKDVEVDLIMHGSPCQDFSIAGRQAGGDIGSRTRSSLMYETIRIVGKIRPRYVIWENVKNILSKKHRHNFDSYLETMKALGYRSYYEVLNAKDYGVPQNRERVFTISIRNDEEGEFEFPEKEELKIRLKDVLEDGVEEKYYLSGKKMKDISKNLDNTTNLQENIRCIQVGVLDIKGHDQMKRVYSAEGISPTLTCMGGGNTEPKIITCNIPQIVKVRKYPVDTEYGLDNNYRIRKLTPKECWRLMGFRDNDFEKAAKICSNSQLYKQAGNSICVPVLQGILRNLLKEE